METQIVAGSNRLVRALGARALVLLAMFGVATLNGQVVRERQPRAEIALEVAGYRATCFSARTPIIGCLVTLTSS
jgi:hypothetical protein